MKQLISFVMLFLKVKTCQADVVQTLVSPIAPMLPAYVVVAWPQPMAPARNEQSPSTARPRLTAWRGGGGTWQARAQAK